MHHPVVPFEMPIQNPCVFCELAAGRGETGHIIDATDNGTSAQKPRDEAEGNRILGAGRRNRCYCETKLQNVVGDSSRNVPCLYWKIQWHLNFKIPWSTNT